MARDVATTFRSVPRKTTNSSWESEDNCNTRVMAVSMSFAVSCHWNVPLLSFLRISRSVLIVFHPIFDGRCKHPSVCIGHTHSVGTHVHRVSAVSGVPRPQQ